MTIHSHFFDLIGRDLSAMLGIAEYLDIVGRDRIANLVRSVTLNMEQTVGDLQHDLFHRPHRAQTKTPRSRKRQHTRDVSLVRSRSASSAIPAREAKPLPRIRQSKPTASRQSN